MAKAQFLSVPQSSAPWLNSVQGSSAVAEWPVGDALRGDSMFTQCLLHAGFLPSSGGAVVVQADMFSQGLHLVSQTSKKRSFQLAVNTKVRNRVLLS